MRLQDFELERYFARYEFEAPYLLCCSDCETATIKDVLDLEGGRTVDLFLDQRLGYTESAGSTGLRSQIAALYRKVGTGDILVTSGAEEAIFIFMNTALSRGDHVIVQYPCYQSLFDVARWVGCEVSKWEVKEENQWELDLDFLAKNIRENTRAIVINSPHNPTGGLISRGKLDRIVDLARGKGILLFSDEVYRFLEYDESERPEAACDLYENAVSLGVMSKAFGLAGLRIGWIATPNSQVFERMAAFKDYTSICNSAPSEFLAALALKHRHRLIERNLGIIRENLTMLDGFFARHAELFHWHRPKAGPVAFPGIYWDGDVEHFCADLVNAKGVLLAPGSYFGCEGSSHFRIGFGRKDMPECLAKLEEYIKEKPR